jgi:hypothetical protein
MGPESKPNPLGSQIELPSGFTEVTSFKEIDKGDTVFVYLTNTMAYTGKVTEVNLKNGPKKPRINQIIIGPPYTTMHYIQTEDRMETYTERSGGGQSVYQFSDWAYYVKKA